MNKTETKSLIEELHKNNGSGSPIVKNLPEKKEKKQKERKPREKKFIEKQKTQEAQSTESEADVIRYTKEEFEKLPAYRRRAYNVRVIDENTFEVFYKSRFAGMEEGKSKISQVQERIHAMLKENTRKVFDTKYFIVALKMKGSEYGDFERTALRKISELDPLLKIHNVSDKPKRPRYEYHYNCDCELCNKA
jgi:hypothetical protein